MNQKQVNLNHRDFEILNFLWKWKVSTTSALSYRFFGNIKLSSAYRRLWVLERGGYICAVSDNRRMHCLWALTKLGFHVIKGNLPELREVGFRSENLSHDLVTSAIHLGGFLFGIPNGVALFSEQELRRLPLEFYPDWVPRSELHRPDGYWHVPVGNPMATVGLEVELSQKKDVKYEIIADFYASQPSIVRVLWLCAKSSMAWLLHEKISKALKHSPMNHNFVSFQNFQKFGWDSVIEHGPEKGKPITVLLGNKPSTARQLVGEKLILDTRKSPHKSRIYRPLELGCFGY